MSFLDMMFSDAYAELTGGKTSFEKQYNWQSGFAPAVSIVGGGASSLAAKMFGTGKAAAAAESGPKVASTASSFPTWAKVAGAGAGIGVGALGLSSLLSGGKQQASGGAGGAGGSDYSNRSVFNPVNTYTYTYSPTTTRITSNNLQNTYNIISGSPNASISSNPNQAPNLNTSVVPSTVVSPTVRTMNDTSGGGGGAGGAGGAAATGTDMTKLALIAAVGLVAYGLVSKK